ncbi:hypothetical protein [Paracoccus shanxieyensis]|uniref:Uncharacterized protein n=1 Tax=Paracoccus shanxieyensis TaxID=2675752 RepID=A0A6L6IT18_9RHOB|nr:hypothetical protein [Paracoccus shanxieyensis]MTH62758.1 hypothetical protein [Paracoccus shanxieyensis]MTH86158.1 hypothetical protein [Paracoccus shanxieyensis]
MKDDLVKRLARAMAGLDGKNAEFEASAANPQQDLRDQTFSRYMFRAEEVMRRSGLVHDLHELRLRSDAAVAA